MDTSRHGLCRDRERAAGLGVAPAACDYLSSFLLYTGVGGAIVAIIVGTLLGTSSEPLVVDSTIGAFEGFWGVEAAGLAPLFPLLFITIACGTISGFHSLFPRGRPPNSSTTRPTLG